MGDREINSLCKKGIITQLLDGLILYKVYKFKIGGKKLRTQIFINTP